MIRTMKRANALVLLALLALLGATAAACGSDSAGDDASSSDAAESTTDEESSDATDATDATDDESAEAPADGEPLQIAYLSASSANTWLASSLIEMEAVAAAGNAEITEFDGQFDPALQSTQFQDVIAAGTYDGVMLVAINGVASVPDIEAALDAGLKVVILNQLVGEDFTTADPQVEGVSASVLAAPLDNGKRLGELTLQACEGIDPCDVVYIYGIKGIPIDEALRLGFDEVIASNPAVSVVAEGEGQYLGPEGGINATQDILQIAPDFNVLVGADQSVQGAEIVLTDEGKLDQVALIGLGGSEPAIAGIADGRWFGGVFGAPGDEGRIAMEALIAAIRDGDDSGGIDPLNTITDGGLMTAANVDSFSPQWAG